MKERNYGLDFLRILSMLMVVTLHVLGQGGLLANAQTLSPAYFGGWFLEIACYGAVNCFAMISGYVMCTSKPRVSRLAELWLQVLFYTLPITAFFVFVGSDTFGLSSLITAIFPITRGYYWYMSAYFGMYLFTPFLNAAIEHIDRRTGAAVLLSALLFLSVLPFVLLYEPYHLYEGYSVIWLMLIYLVGGYLRKFAIADKIKASVAWLMYGACTVTTFVGYIVLDFLSSKLPTAEFADTLVKYTSPTIVLGSVFLCLACIKMSVPKWLKAVLAVASPAALGVYLAHLARPIWILLFKDFSIGFLNYPAIVTILLVLSSSLAIYLICTAIDLLRIQLFRLLRIHALCEKFETFIKRLWDKLPVG